MNNLRVTNTLLLLLVVPAMFYLLKILGFILIPLVAAMFISLLFLPLMRKMARAGIPKILSLVSVLLIILVLSILGIQVLQIAAHEISQTDDQFLALLTEKLNALQEKYGSMLGLGNSGAGLSEIFSNAGSGIGSVIDLIRKSATGLLMTVFFVVLLLAGSFNLQVFLKNFLFKKEYVSIKLFRRIERDIQKFVVVKFIVSLFTGIGFSLACYFFGVDFPIFWGLFAFAINFVQMIGSVISVILLSAFALVQLDATGTLAAFVLVISGVQVLFGAILEPIFMGKTFSINVITILVMLMLWGFIWGIPGLIMAIPITVFLKIALEQFPKTQRIAQTMEGPKDNSLKDWFLPKRKVS